MKCSKWGVLTILGLLTLSGLTAALFTSAEDTSVDIQDNIKNAVQHIWTVKILDKKNITGAILSQQWSGQVGINTNNFLIIKSGDDTTKIKGTSAASSILWWVKNTINGSNNATILAWSWNQLSSSNDSIIVWWVGNTSSSSKTTAIIWWSNNTINSSSESSIIVGWESNTLRWKFSAILWKNNNITWNYSVSLWQNSNLKGSNSFLWTDGSYSNKQLLNNDVFAVVSEWWMVVNTDTRNPLSKLTISGSLVVWENTTKNNSIACWWWDWMWILKLVRKDAYSNQSCLCSCDWYTWNSLYWNGKCAWVCNEMLPKCGTAISKIYLTETEYVYSWSCEEWVVIPKSYYVEWETIYWHCQTSDGEVEKCSTDSNNVEIIETICYPSTSSCGKGYKTWWTAWNPGYTCELNGKTESCECPEGKVWDWYACVSVNRWGVCRNGVENPSSDWCNIWNWKAWKTISNWSLWDCVWKDKSWKSINYNSSTCYSCNSDSVWDEDNQTCNKQSDVCNPSSSSCNGWYTLSWWAAWWYNYYCKKSWSSDVTCTCLSWTIWDGTKCSDISGPCNNTAANPSTAWCYIWNYANVSEENWYVWNCKDADGDNLNGDSACHKCDSDATWDGELCVKKSDICDISSSSCNGWYTLSWWVVWWYNYYCNKEWVESLTCNCWDNKIWNGAGCVSIGETPLCNIWATDVTSDGCTLWVYSGVQITNGYNWDCLDADWTKLNSGWICYKCDNGFSWNDDLGQCTEIPPDGRCTLSDAQHTILVDWETIEMYYDSEEYCPNICQKHVVTQCINGVISGSTNPLAEYEEYCDTYGVFCTEATLDTCPDHWVCNACTWYTFSDNICTIWDTKQYLASCTWWYKKYWTWCFSTRDYACLIWWGTWTINKNAEEAWYIWGEGYYDSDWRIIEEWIESYYKTWTCWSTISCSSKWYDCWWTFVPKQQYRRSYTIYAEHYLDYHQCSNNSSLNYYTVSEDEDWNEVYVEEDDDYTDATHQHWECWSNASEVCWDESDGLY